VRCTKNHAKYIITIFPRHRTLYTWSFPQDGEETDPKKTNDSSLDCSQRTKIPQNLPLASIHQPWNLPF